MYNFGNSNNHRLYNILQLDQNCNEQDIKRQFKKLAMKYHPDRNKGDPKSEEKFKEIQEAYEILSDKEKRKKYNAYGEQYFQKNNQPNNSTFDMFNELFRTTRKCITKPEPIHKKILLTKSNRQISQKL